MNKSVWETIVSKAADLFTMKSAIALAVCIAFCSRVFAGEVSTEDLKTVFMMVLTAYFTANFNTGGGSA